MKKESQQNRTDDEFGLAMQHKGSWRACFHCIRKPGEKPDMKVKYLWARGMQPRTERPVLDAFSSSYSEWNADKKRSSQQWKFDELMEVMLRCRCCDDHILPTTMTCWVMWWLIGRRCGDDTHKSRSVIKFLHEWYLSRLSLLVRWRMPSASLPLLFFFVCASRVMYRICQSWLLRVMLSHRLFVHETRLSAVFKAYPSLLSGSSLLSLMCRHIWILTGQIVSECSEVW